MDIFVCEAAILHSKNNLILLHFVSLLLLLVTPLLKLPFYYFSLSLPLSLSLSPIPYLNDEGKAFSLKSDTFFKFIHLMSSYIFFNGASFYIIVTIFIN